MITTKIPTRMSPITEAFIIISLLLQTISSQRPIMNSSTSATAPSSSLFNAYEALSPSTAPAAPAPPQIPQTRSDVAKLRFKPGPNNGSNRTIIYNDRIGKFMELKESMRNATIYSPNGLSSYPHDGYYYNRRGTPLDKLKKMVKDTSYSSNIHNKTNPSQGDDTLPYSKPYNGDPIKKVKNAFQQPINYLPQSDNSEWDGMLGVTCDFETKCMWTWDETIENGFQNVSGINLTESNRTGMMPGPSVDGQNDASGHFLHLRITQDTPQLSLTSPVFSTTRENCYLEVLLHESEMSYGSVKIVIIPQDSPQSSWVPAEIAGDNLNKWQLHTFKIGRVSKDFKIELEVFPNGKNWTDGQTRGHISIDNLRLVHCFPEGAVTGKCSPQQVRCTSSKIPVCIRLDRICDIDVDCDLQEDELLNCDKMPFGSRCDFENGWCGWQNTGKAMMEWSRHSGPTPTDKTGPNYDHTFQHNDTLDGHFLFVNMNQHANDTEKQKSVGFASNAVINSQIFNPPPRVHSNASSPYRNSCMVRFYVHQFGYNAGSINLSIVEMKDKENITTTLWWSTKNMGENWHRAEQLLPNVTARYYFQFEARMGMRIYSDVAIDDFSLSPECFGLNIPEEHLNGYNYWDPHLDKYKEPHKDFEETKYYELSTCGAKGRYGPTPDGCRKAYNGTDVDVMVSTKPPFNGTQRWKVPNEGYYTIIVKGAGGGLGSAGVGSSRGASVMSVVELHKNEEIHVLVGQSGEHACIKSLGQRDEPCEDKNQSQNKNKSKVYQVREMHIEDGAGGGGGASYVFLFNSAKNPVPLLIAAGGGGLGIGRFNDDFQHGRGEEVEDEHRTGNIISMDDRPAGPGGGWQDGDEPLLNTTGLSLLSSSIGGLACYQRGYHGHGGFGGGGGGCSKGGGGGGYTGGDTMFNSSNGQGGTSYLSSSRKHHIWFNIESAANSGAGSVIIIPAIEGCGCDYRCVALDEYRANFSCICPQGWQLSPYNLTSCEIIEIPHDPASMTHYIILLIVVASILVLALAALIFMLYNRYQRKKQAELRHKMLLEQDLQLSRLRNTPDSITSPSVNIDYGCDGILNNGNVDVQSLPQVARESLRLVKALGQGAFGEVYQGLYRHRDGDAVEMPVAVKTLPEMSTGQAESDFLMEAAIMAKFNHPNIVHLIGVCFDRHPRFIVLELLAGGDLKNFLREGRSKPERPSPLAMKDLVFCALDVAKGCRYLESKRFIHRDIAARNCLLSSKGPGRVVKIADFGMARDIYRSDYYRKGGKAMLPIKWMPPEAFLDGIFTSKTDVWSFGVLLWEVFSLGLMPYTGLPNRDVMQLVTGGGRLDAPVDCPMAIYRIMADCWNPTPELRPSFSNLLERLTACSQDADIMNAPLPVFNRQQSNERDCTIMRPPGHDDFCLQVPNSDYLVPLPDTRSTVERLLTEATGVTLPDTMTTNSAPKMTKSWETSFSMANGKPHTQSVNSNDKLLHKESSTEKLISLDTPQQTPTTIQPPPMNFMPLSALNNNDTNSSTINPVQSQQHPITLDPAMLNRTTTTVNGGPYANVKVMNANNLSELQDKLCSNNTTNNTQTPFTIQGFNDRHNIARNENHSEISC